MIRVSSPFRIPSAIQTAKKMGMILLDDYLFELYGKKMISYEELINKAQSPQDLAVKIKASYSEG